MNCNDARARLPGRSTLTPREATALDEHLSGCAACRAEAEGLDALTRFLVLHPPEPPQDLAFAMMGDRVWAQLEAHKKRRAWAGLFAWLGAAAAAAFAVLFFWPQQNPVPEPTLDEIAAALGERDPSLPDLGGDLDLSDLDEESAARLDAQLSRVLPTPQEEEPAPLLNPGGVYDELDDLSPEELERLEQLLLKKKG